MPRRVYMPGEKPDGDPVFFVSWDSVDRFVRLQSAIGPDDEIEIAVHEDGFDIYKVPEHTVSEQPE